MTKEEMRIEKLYDKRRFKIITNLRTSIINILIDDEIYLENVDHIIEKFISEINDFLK